MTERTGASPALWAGQSLLGRPSSNELRPPPVAMETASWLGRRWLPPSLTALPPAVHVLPTPDLGTAGLGVSRTRACVTQASPGVPRPHSASLPCSAWMTHTSRLSLYMTQAPEEGTLGPPSGHPGVLETSSEGLQLRRQEAGPASPFVGHCESHRGRFPHP